MFSTQEYLVGQTFPDEIFVVDGKTGREHMEMAKVRVEAWMYQRFHYGFTEWYSNNYYPEDVGPMANFIQFAERRGDGEADDDGDGHHLVRYGIAILEVRWLRRRVAAHVLRVLAVRGTGVFGQPRIGRSSATGCGTSSISSFSPTKPKTLKTRGTPRETASSIVSAK
ncbi:MAG: hypothetical protein MZU97_05925 [Bacillus subtilis]|nr:hypothetical protein [Bacillus subtilis]